MPLSPLHFMEFTSYFPLPPLGGEGRVRGVWFKQFSTACLIAKTLPDTTESRGLFVTAPSPPRGDSVRKARLVLNDDTFAFLDSHLEHGYF